MFIFFPDSSKISYTPPLTWSCKPIYQPGNGDLGIMVSIPAHPETKGGLQGDVLTGETERHEGRGRVREGHTKSVDLPKWVDRNRIEGDFRPISQLCLPQIGVPVVASYGSETLRFLMWLR